MKILNIIFSNAIGGESYVFGGISKHYGATELIIYDRNKEMISDKVYYPVRPALNLLIRLNREQGIFLSSIISSLFLKRAFLKEFDFIILNSSSLTIPKFKGISVIMYTPPRALTDRSEITKKKLRDAGIGKSILFTLMKGTLNILYRMSLHNSDNILCISKNVRDRLLRYYRVSGKVFYLFVDVELFRYERFGDYFLCVSRINEAKRQHLAIDAFKKFCNLKKGFRLIIAGTIDDTEWSSNYYEGLVDQARGYPVEFIISPTDEEVRNLYANCYATLFAAENEDFGLVPLESMASFKPVIAFNEGGPKETVVDGETGFLVEGTEMMAQRMLYLVDNQEKAREIGINGRKFVEMEFSKKAFFARMDSTLGSRVPT